MVGIDTNILVRFITQDDSEQSLQVNELLLSDQKFFLPNIILVETVWVLRRIYNWKKVEVVSAFETLLEIANFVFEDEAAVSHATWAYLVEGDWADHLIQAQSKKYHCTSLLTFDKKFSKFYPDFVKLLS